jgi:hypothetical protein
MICYPEIEFDQLAGNFAGLGPTINGAARISKRAKIRKQTDAHRP